MTIDELYRYVQFLANKEQRGFIKPTEFNLLAERAQLDVIRDRYGKIGTNQASPSAPQSHSVLDDLAPGGEKATITYDSSGVNDAFSYPTDYLYFMRMTLAGKNVEIITHDQLAMRLDSQLMAPSADYPIAVMIDEGFEIYSSTTEDTSGTVVLTYIKKPVAPFWAYVISNGTYIYSSTMNENQQLTLAESTHNEIAQRMLSYIGISLRDQEPLSYAEGKITQLKE